VDLANKIKDIIELETGNISFNKWMVYAPGMSLHLLFIDNAVPCTSEEFPRKAKRPNYLSTL
jgi:dTDP-4-dehydrorhamnose reductase